MGSTRPLGLTGRPQLAPFFAGKPIAPGTGIRGKERPCSGASGLCVSRVRPVHRSTRHQRGVHPGPRSRGETAHRDDGAVQELSDASEVRVAGQALRHAPKPPDYGVRKVSSGPDYRPGQPRFEYTLLDPCSFAPKNTGLNRFVARCCWVGNLHRGGACLPNGRRTE